ncbi:Lactoylglutathione lyase [hydrothermal vent metagenome]|uniref:lactoylglutathione lyase n=1 Tax=hydrothermal vent metagenome TaxID=652676 RepID=A0A3B0X1N4_9ZZZZ
MRLLHTMLRVGNLERSVQFYSTILGMTLLRQKEYPEGKFTLAFLGYGDEKNHTALELTYNWDIDNYDLGTAFGHLAIEVDDVYNATEKIRAAGGKIIREPGPMNAGTTLLAFVADPDGYEIELLQPKA